MSMMRTATWVIAAALALSTAGQPPTSPREYFPSPAKPKARCGEAASIDDFTVQWYGKHLLAAREPSLFQQAGRALPSARESLRLTWLRSFDAPVTVRVEWMGAMSAQLVAVRLSGLGGYEPGDVVERLVRPLSTKEAATLRTMLMRTRIFDLPASSCDAPSVDGAEWILEDVDARGYHLIVRRSPGEGGVRDLGLALLELTGWSLTPVY